MTERELGIIIAKLEALHEDISELRKFNEELSSRVRTLETFKSWATGAGAICVGLCGVAIKYVTGLIS